MSRPAINARNRAAETTGSSPAACIGGVRGLPEKKFVKAALAHEAGRRGRRIAAHLLSSRQNWRTLGTRSCGKFPAMIAALIAPMAVPAIQLGRTPDFSSAE